jgi:hypothetical protein
MSVLRIMYLFLAALGVLNWIYLAANLGEIQLIQGADLPGFWHLTEEAFRLHLSLWIGGFAMSIWVAAETYVRKNWLALIVLPLTFFTGFGVGLPLYLFLRTRPVA